MYFFLWGRRFVIVGMLLEVAAPIEEVVALAIGCTWYILLICCYYFEPIESRLVFLRSVAGSVPPFLSLLYLMR